MTSFEDRVNGIRETVQGKAKKEQTKKLSSGTSTEASSKQLNTIATGKAAPVGPSGQSNVAEQLAQQSSIGQLDAVTEQTNQQLDSMQIQAQQADVQQKAVESDRRSKELQVDTQRSIETENILSQFKNGNLDLESEKGQFQLQVLGSHMARNNKRYMQKVKEVAAKRQIKDKASHMREGIRLQIGNARTELYKNMNFLNSEGDLQRDFKEKMMKMGADDLFKVADAAIADSREAAKIGAVTGIAKAGTDYVAKKYDKPQSTSTDGEVVT